MTPPARPKGDAADGLVRVEPDYTRFRVFVRFEPSGVWCVGPKQSRKAAELDAEGIRSCIRYAVKRAISRRRGAR